MIGDDLMAEVSTRKNGRSDMEDRVNNVCKIIKFSAHPNFDGNKT